MASNLIAVRTVFCPVFSDESYLERGVGSRKAAAGGRPFVFTPAPENF